MMQLKDWTTPRLETHGKVADLTRQSNNQNKDAPTGTNNTAFPNS